jgi:ribosomal protein S18 acetylase RimI-like enzyme
MTATVLPRAWDSTFFDARVFEAHLEGGGRLDEVVREAVREKADCLYVFVDAGDLESIEEAVRTGGRLVDLRVELAGEIQPVPVGAVPATRLAAKADRDALVHRAAELARESRFSRDPRIPAERVREMYEIWVDRCLDEGVVMVPAHGHGGFVGVRSEGDVAQVELVYVAASSRGEGLGGALVRDAVAALGVTDASVVTQTGNIPAQRLYQSLGLRSRSTLAVLHLWLDESVA